MTTDLAEGYAALTGAAGAVRLDRDVLRVSGPDAVSYLQGQLSQDVAALDVGATAWSLVLTPQGKVDAWVRVTRTGPDELHLDLDGGFGEALLARLQRFKLRVKADLEQLDWSCVAVRGPESAAAPIPAGSSMVIPFAWGDFAGVDLLGPDLAVPAGVALVDPDAYELCRIEAGLPRLGAELTEKTIPEEAGIVAASVSFTKGCYTGQELVARIDSRGGNVPRRLRAVRLEEGGPLPGPGSTVEVNGKAVGALTSAVRHPDGHGAALAYVQRDVDLPAAALCAGVAATITALVPIS